MYEIYLHIFEIGTILSTLAIFLKEREDKNLQETLILAILYGLILETINVYSSSSYYYNKAFLFQIFKVPVVIGFGWAIIYYGSKKITDNYKLKWWQAPILMAIFALSMDIVDDPIAIRIGLWHWNIPLDKEWFGVPYDNFMGWIIVVWAFSFFINLAETKHFRTKISRVIKYLSVIISPILLDVQITAFVALAAIMSGKFSLKNIIEYYKAKNFTYAYSPEVQTYKAYIFFSILFFLVLYLLVIIYRNRRNITPRLNKFPFAVLSLTYLFFFITFISTKIKNSDPAIGIIFLVSMTIYLLISIFPLYICNQKRTSSLRSYPQIIHID